MTIFAAVAIKAIETLLVIGRHSSASENSRR
jgi:hypothetical protein